MLHGSLDCPGVCGFVLRVCWWWHFPLSAVEAFANCPVFKEEDIVVAVFVKDDRDTVITSVVNPHSNTVVNSHSNTSGKKHD